MTKRDALDLGEYQLRRPWEVETPAFLVFEDLVRHNIAEALRLCGSPAKLVPHVKTHKSAEVLKLQMEAGMTSFKCATLREAEMLMEHDATEVIVAYPLLHPRRIERFMALKQRHSTRDVKLIASTTQQLEALSEAALASNQEVGVYVDLDTGMHRTGVRPGEEAGRFYAQLATTPGLRAVGVHVFDGQTFGTPDPAERKAQVAESLGHIRDLWDRAAAQGLDVEDTVVGGSWSFHLYLDEDKIRVSPGTWIYWDTNNARMPDLGFKIAAVVLGQVVDADDGAGTVTVDIGLKAITTEMPLAQRFKVIAHDGVEVAGHSEEHAVLRLNGASLGVGDMVLAAPGHACTTSVKYPGALLVNGAGDIAGRISHQARDREPS